MSIDPRLGGKVSLENEGMPPIFGTVEELQELSSITWVWRTAEGEPTQVSLVLESTQDGCRLRVREQMISYEIVYVPPFRG